MEKLPEEKVPGNVSPPLRPRFSPQAFIVVGGVALLLAMYFLSRGGAGRKDLGYGEFIELVK
ncbi:MAG TPA: hypothetical protein VGX76_15845, partial [Pirellulales bacterium]|nr:hypothetical protein [Pirellulales bacterium]